MEFATDEIAVAGIEEKRNNASVLQPSTVAATVCIH